ncbi:MAG: class I SAM-dependent methyltransferase [Anaerolineales bacterium]|nr:class I SAM-dependent methyltransferase [Anaerolineales bacterium]
MIDFYADPKNVEDYIKMAEGYDGKELIPLLNPYLPEGASVLELGMGPGVDLDILSQRYQVTGSDRSPIFLERYRQKNENADLLLLDAITLETERRFDAIYSNKVLHHLTPEELKQSLEKQRQLLNVNGVLLHSFWYGDEEETMHGMHFTYYTEGSLRACVSNAFDVLALRRFTEMDPDDSFYIILRKSD